MGLIKKSYDAAVLMLRSTRLFLSLLAISVVFFASSLDGFFRPAVRDFNINYERSYIKQSEYLTGNSEVVLTDVAVLYGSMNKIKCRKPSATAMGYSRTRGTAYVGLNFMDRPSGDQTQSRDPGPQEFGPWEVTMTPRDDIWGVVLEAAHKCGIEPFSWTVYTTLGPIIEISKLKRVSLK